MKYLEKNRFRQGTACLALALSTMSLCDTASAGVEVRPDIGNEVIWCLGEGVYTPIPGFVDAALPFGKPNPDGSDIPWANGGVLDQQDSTGVGPGRAGETAAPAPPNGNDRYVMQLDYWNWSGASPYGNSHGTSCMLFDYNAGAPGMFTITYPAKPSEPRVTEYQWYEANWASLPNYFVPYADFDANHKFIGPNPTKGGPTGYISTFKGCSWDANSCTTGSAIPAAGKVPVKSADTNVFPERLSDVTSIPTQWEIYGNYHFGYPFQKTPYVSGQPQPQVWDASYDIWFDKTANTNEGLSTYNVRGQNDGLEIMVWMNSNGSYVDALPQAGSEGNAGLITPTGHIRERVVINGVLYDVWVGRLNNPYFGPVGGKIILPTQEPHECSTLPGTLCGTEWNVVSFVASKDSNGTDYRKMTMSLDAKVFTDYLLGIDDGLWKVYGLPIVDEKGTTGTVRTANQKLQCPKSNKDQSLAADKADCLDPNWFLMSIQAGFEPWVGGNGLQSNSFKAHVITKSTGIQTGLVNGAGDPIIHWQTPFELVYSGCPVAGATAGFYIDGTNSDTNTPMRYPASGTLPMMQDPVTKQFTAQVNQQMYPMHGDAFVHFVPNPVNPPTCVGEDVKVFIDPSGRVFYSDGKTPVQSASVTLQYSPSGNQAGPFSAVPNNNVGLSSPVMQPNDNTQNPMLSTAFGSYAWNTVAGWYKVNATLAGCGSVTTAAQQVTVNHPIENLNITLPCAAPAPLPAPPGPTTPGVKVALTVNGADWGAGYCRNLILTNTTSKAVTWKVSFNLPAPGTVSQSWNLNYTKSGNSISASGIGWNNVLQPGQVLNAGGFCVLK